MSFTLGFLLYILGSIVVAVAMLAVPGRRGEHPAAQSDGHGHGGH